MFLLYHIHLNGLRNLLEHEKSIWGCLGMIIGQVSANVFWFSTYGATSKSYNPVFSKLIFFKNMVWSAKYQVDVKIYPKVLDETDLFTMNSGQHLLPNILIAKMTPTTLLKITCLTYCQFWVPWGTLIVPRNTPSKSMEPKLSNAVLHAFCRVLDAKIH